MPNEPIHVALQKRNERQPWCSVEGCNNPRYHLASMCQRHHQHTRRHGHPTEVSISLKELRPFIKRARDFLDDHADHPGTVEAVRFVRGLMRDGAKRGDRGHRSTHIMNRYLSLLRTRAVDPTEVLVMMVAMHLHRSKYPWRYPDDLRPYYTTTPLTSDHFWFRQVGMRVVKLMGTDKVTKHGYRQPWGSGGLFSLRAIDRLSLILMGTIGMVAKRAAAYVEQYRPDLDNIEQVKGSHVAFRDRGSDGEYVDPQT